MRSPEEGVSDTRSSSPTRNSVHRVERPVQTSAYATAAAIHAAGTLDLPVLGWTLPDAVARRLREEHGAPFDGYAATEIDLVLTVDRALQLEAVGCHPSQAVPGSVMWRRIELLGDHEHLRWLRHARSPLDDGNVRPTDPGL